MTREQSTETMAVADSGKVTTLVVGQAKSKVTKV